MPLHGGVCMYVFHFPCPISYSVSCLDNNSQEFEVCCYPKLLLVGCSMECECYFRPKDAIKYKEEVVFELNGNCRRVITLRGEGTTTKVLILVSLRSIYIYIFPAKYETEQLRVLLQVDLADPAHKLINLGAVRVRQKVIRRVKLVNRTLLPVTFSVFIIPSSKLPVLQEPGVLSVCLVRQVGKTGEVTISAGKECQLLPSGECSLEVTFCPRSRMPNFTEEVSLHMILQAKSSAIFACV